MNRGALLITLALIVTPTLAQRTLEFSADTMTGDGVVTPTLTWSTSPPAQSCTASGQWSGEKGPSGTETVGPLTGSATFNLECRWPGDSIATLSWTNPTQNTNGTPYTDPKGTMLAYRLHEDPRAIGCEQHVESSDRPAGCVWVNNPTSQMRTITGLTGVGEYRFVAYACNQRNICGAPSNIATKTFTGTVTVVESAGIQVNPVPSSIAGLTAE